MDEEHVGSLRRPDTELQRSQVKHLMLESGENISVGDLWYVIPLKWWHTWKEFVRYDDDDTPKSDTPSREDSEEDTKGPGMIRNSNFLNNNENTLREGLVENKDFQLVPQEVFGLLRDWYGVDHAVDRPVITSGYKEDLVVEVYGLSFTLKRFTGVSDAAAKQRQASKAILANQIAIAVARKARVDVDYVQLWRQIDDDGSTDYVKLDLEKTLEENMLYNGSTIVWEVRGVDQSWPITNYLRKRKANAVRNIGNTKKSKHSHAKTGGATRAYLGLFARKKPTTTMSMPLSPSSVGSRRGVCGLTNLGNTCFMNSALQCLSNTQALTQYFLSDRYLKDINRENPLGMKGELAERYGTLVNQLWSGRLKSVTPTDFKYCIGKFAPQFSGYRQHDSQELLAFLLDGLHEDVNLVLKKPFVETRECDGQDELEASRLAWADYQKRNRSVIVDLFQGQLKSTLECTNCPKVSVTFDPLMYLSVPLPSTSNRRVKVTYFAKDGSPPVRYGIEINTDGTIGELCSFLAEIVSAAEPQLVPTDVYEYRVYRQLSKRKRISAVKDNELLNIYQVDEMAPNSILLTVLQKRRCQGEKERRMSILCGHPRMISFCRSDTFAELYHSVDRCMRAFHAECTEETRDSAKPPFTLHIAGLSNPVVRQALTYSEKAIGSYLNQASDLVLVWDESVPTLSDNMLVRYHESSKKLGSSIRLEECLEYYTLREQLGKADEWYCPSCKTFVPAFKKFDLWRLPDVLVVHMKRFCSVSNTWRTKLDELVEFPLEGWDLSPFVARPTEDEENPPVYDLYAVSYHVGGMGGGHYTAAAKNCLDGNWYKFNDTQVTELSSQASLVTASAYLLFYSRRTRAQSHL